MSSNPQLAPRANDVSPEGRRILGRLERIPVWALPGLFIGVIGIGFLFTFYDIFDINVSFIQTSMNIIPGTTPETAGNFLGFPVLLNLVGYVLGTLILSPIADRIGRRNMLLITMVITGLGSLYTGVIHDYNSFNISRLITGIGVGADLAVVNTYINEVAPSRSRAKYTSLIFIMSALGAFIGVWLGLLLTTPATPFPLGLPFALASAHFAYGWRVMYLIGALLAVVGILIRTKLPESPRWLISMGREEEAEAVVSMMEQFASRHVTLPEPLALKSMPQRSQGLPYAQLLRNPMYLRRVITLLLVWLFSYITVYALAAGLTTIMAGLKYPAPEAGLIVALGVSGFILCAICAYLFGEKLERKTWLILSALLTIVGGVIIATAGTSFSLAVIGAIVTFFGFNLWIPMSYAWTTENFPTSARTTGFALVDGLGHIGAGFGILLIAPNIPALGPLKSMLLIAGFLVIAAIVAQFGIRTKGKSLEEVSP